MKIRQGFVSNSSSSSFLLAFKDEDKARQEFLEKVLKVPQDSPVYSCCRHILGIFFDSQNELQGDKYFDDFSEKEVDLGELRKNKFKIYSGDVESYDYPEAFVHDMTINYESPTLIVKKMGGH